MTAATNIKQLHAPANDTTVRFPGGKVGVLLLHGLDGTPAEVRYVAMGLNKAGYTVHTPQLFGHGPANAGDSKGQDWYRSRPSYTTPTPRDRTRPRMPSSS